MLVLPIVQRPGQGSAGQGNLHSRESPGWNPPLHRMEQNWYIYGALAIPQSLDNNSRDSDRTGDVGANTIEMETSSHTPPSYLLHKSKFAIMSK